MNNTSSEAKHTPKELLLLHGNKLVLRTEYEKRVLFSACPTDSEAMSLMPLFAAAPETAAERDRLKELNGELLEALADALAQTNKLDFSLSTNWNGSIKTNIVLILENAIVKAEGRA